MAAAVAGVACVILPVLFPRYAFPLIWGSLFLLVDPLNAALGKPSLLLDMAQGRFRTAACFAAAGLICGLFWEFWNYWAIVKWVYTVPYVPNARLFEMPVLGYLGYLPFGLEVFAVTTLVVPTLLAEIAGLPLRLGTQRASNVDAKG